jgi:hypothetical protein
MECIKIESNLINQIWILVKDLIQNSCDRAGGFADANDVKSWLEQDKMQLWVAWDNNNKTIKCVCVTEIRVYPKFKVCDCKITTGTNYKSWVNFMDIICKWAKLNNCKKMEIFTRPGWERILKHKGFIKTHVQLEKNL